MSLKAQILIMPPVQGTDPQSIAFFIKQVQKIGKYRAGFVTVKIVDGKVCRITGQNWATQAFHLMAAGIGRLAA